MGEPHAERGSRIRQARLAKGIGQAQLGRSLDVTATNVWKWEVGKHLPDADTLNRLASALGVSLDWIMRGEGDGPAADSVKGDAA